MRQALVPAETLCRTAGRLGRRFMWQLLFRFQSDGPFLGALFCHKSESHEATVGGPSQRAPPVGSFNSFLEGRETAKVPTQRLPLTLMSIPR